MPERPTAGPPPRPGGTVTPLPTMMPGAVVPPPRRPAPTPTRRSGTLAERIVRDAFPADAAERSSLGADQIRHLATQHALTFHYRTTPPVDLEDLLDDAAVIARYIATGELPDGGTHA
jgi:hypothetical protein